MGEKGNPRIYLVILIGGGSFYLQAGIGPPIHHQGGRTVGFLRVSPEDMSPIRDMARAQGAIVEVREIGGETPAQAQERRRLATPLAVVDLPCVECLKCPWLSPDLPDPCGARGELRDAYLEADPKMAKALEDCPVLQGP